MKHCPQCGHAYGDDSLNYCLADGTLLVPVYGATEEPTVVLPSPKPAPITNKVMVGGVSPLFKYLALALSALLLLLVGGGGIALLLMWPKDERSKANNSERSSFPTQNPTPANSERPPALQPTRAPVDNKNTQVSTEPPAPKNTPQRSVVDPGLTRITFRKGRVGETVSGDLNRKREFVLRTLAGQLLSATVRSTNGCAVFDNGDQSTSFSTNRGDTFLRIENSCDDPIRFSLAITVR